ncbi:MAG: acetyl-CoA carboxylase biotin carboxyl carrier protein subunit [Candidatus Rokuibacteriota bacterium]
MRFVATVAGASETVEITGEGGRYRLTLGDRVLDVDARRTGQGTYSILIDGASYAADVATGGDTVTVRVRGRSYDVEVEEETRHRLRAAGAAATARGTLKAPLPGKVTHVAVRRGDRVAAGDTLLVIGAMKMENEFKAGASGIVAEVRVQAGQPVNAGDVLVVIE